MQLTVFGATGNGTMSGFASAGTRPRRHRVRTRRTRSRPGIRTSTWSLATWRSDDVERVVNGQDVVLMSLGVKMGVADQVCTIATATIVPAMQKYGVRRLINVAGVGTGEARAHSACSHA